MRPADIIERAYEEAKKAVLLDPEAAEARYALAFWYSFYGNDSNKTISEWEEAMRLGPQLAQVRCIYAIWGLGLGEQRWDDAVSVVAEGVAADPLNGFAHSMLALLKVFARRNDEVVEDALRGIAIDPESFWGQWAPQRCYQAAGMHEESIQQASLVLSMSGRHPWPLTELAVTYASIGNTEAADAIYCELAEAAGLGQAQGTNRQLVEMSARSHNGSHVR